MILTGITFLESAFIREDWVCNNFSVFFSFFRPRFYAVLYMISRSYIPSNRQGYLLSFFVFRTTN